MENDERLWFMCCKCPTAGCNGDIGFNRRCDEKVCPKCNGHFRAIRHDNTIMLETVTPGKMAHILEECGRDRNGTMLYKGDIALGSGSKALYEITAHDEQIGLTDECTHYFDTSFIMILWQRSPENAAALAALEAGK